MSSGGCKEQFLQLLNTLDITKVTSMKSLTCIFKSLGKLMLENIAEKCFLDLKTNVYVSGENSLLGITCVSLWLNCSLALCFRDSGAFMTPLTTGRVTIPSIVTYSAKVGIAIAIRYSLTRRAFSVTPNGPEVLLLDYPSHQRRLLPLLAKTYALNFAPNFLKRMYVKRKPEMIKTLHVVSSAF
ncbi:PREDICTED: acyl-coenzyme A oxidase 3, peroxisomal-like [Ipomoea nil]|uniref:acyl-coenzyme A oxidase 3, peroxisomal-like n=1 Tax=Ipomoea nil TaxID=35883 RepID=UPI000900A670|nr:PREDICTED: acyl-coenzyme A oxidase 3, peroxisomal-like [Ipomoea nil]